MELDDAERELVAAWRRGDAARILRGAIEVLEASPSDSHGHGSYFFLSYAGADRSTAVQLEGLLRRCGVSVWLAEQELSEVQRLEARFQRAIGNCAALVAIYSERTKETNWPTQEAGWAVSAGKDILTLIADDSSLSSLPAPYRNSEARLFGGMRWFDVRASGLFPWLLDRVPRSDRGVQALRELREATVRALKSQERPELPAGLPQDSSFSNQAHSIQKATEIMQQEAWYLTLTGTGHLIEGLDWTDRPVEERADEAARLMLQQADPRLARSFRSCFNAVLDNGGSAVDSVVCFSTVQPSEAKINRIERCPRPS